VVRAEVRRSIAPSPDRLRCVGGAAALLRLVVSVRGLRAVGVGQTACGCEEE